LNQFFLPQIRIPKIADKELIAINLTSEYMGIDSKCQLFLILPSSLNTKIEHSVYNRRKWKLFAFQELNRVKLVTVLTRPKIRLHNFWSY